MRDAQHHINRAQEYFGDSGITDSSGTNTAKAQAQAAIAMAISLDRIAKALEALAEAPKVTNVISADRSEAKTKASGPTRKPEAKPEPEDGLS